MLKLIKIYIFIIALLLPAPAYAIIYYVDPATGDNTFDGKTIAHAWETVAGGNSVNFTQDDQIKILEGVVWRTYDAPDRQSQVLASTIITRARYALNEAAESFWLDTEMLVWVNDGIQDIVNRTNCIEAKENITLVDGQLLYDIGTEYISIKYAVYRYPEATYNLLQETGDALLQENGDNILIGMATDYKGLSRGSYQNLGHEEAVEEPVLWFVWKDQIGVYPLTGSDAGGDVVTVFLIAQPYEVPSDANIPLPAMYDNLLVDYVIAQALLKEGYLASSKAIMDFYTQTLDRFRVDFIHRPKESNEIR